MFRFMPLVLVAVMALAADAHPPIWLHDHQPGQTVTVDVPETYYETEKRSRTVQITRMIPTVEDQVQEYDVQVPKTRMVPRTFSIPGHAHTHTPIGCPGCHCPGCPEYGQGVDGPDFRSQTDPEPAGCLQRLRARRSAKRGRAGS